MRRFLPPLLLALVFGAIAVRMLLEPSRGEAREQISGLVQAGVFDEATQRLERYLARYDEDEDAWFATWVWFRSAQPERAIEQIWGHPSLPGKPDTARRFARTALYAIGWEDEARNDPTVLEPFCLLALAEGDDAWAAERLRRHARELDLMESTRYFFPAYRRATHRPMDLIVAEFRKRGDERFDTAAALGALQGKEDAAAAKDGARLLEVLADDRWRRTFRDVWCVAGLTLGRRGSSENLAALELAAAALDGSVNELDQQDRQLVLVGLLAAGRFDVHDEIAPAVYGDDGVMIVTVWYLEALIHRYLSGDARSEVWLRRMWEGPGSKYRGLRDRVARAFLLQDARPDEAAMEAWVGRMLTDLERPDAPPMEHVLARSFAQRAGLPDARERLLALLRDLAARFHPGDGAAAELSEPFVECLRALYLYS
ncbi:MAG: hypothetical protein O2894_03060 [Planctomycetota bacterium]|nr:hypothetical protein [Planctomycetota bacterium]